MRCFESLVRVLSDIDSFDRITTWLGSQAVPPENEVSRKRRREAGQLLQTGANAMQRNATLQLQDGSGWSCSPEEVGHMMSKQKGRILQQACTDLSRTPTHFLTC